MSNEERREGYRSFTAAALCDFVSYLTELSDATIIGGHYPKVKILTIFGDWCKKRNIDISKPDGEAWLVACRTGLLNLREDESDANSS